MSHTFRQFDRNTLYLLPPSSERLVAGRPSGPLRRRDCGAAGPHVDQGRLCRPWIQGASSGDVVGAAVLRVRDWRVFQPQIGTWNLRLRGPSLSHRQ